MLFCWNPPAGQPAAMTTPRRFSRQPSFPPGGGCLVADIRMPRVSGLELTPFASRRIAVSADFCHRPRRCRAGRRGHEGRGGGFSTKTLSRPALSGRHQTRGGTQPRPPRRQPAQPGSPRHPHPLVTARNRVARWLALGWANKTIARQLAISEHTVHVHRQYIMDKPTPAARPIWPADPARRPAGLDEAGVAAD